MQIGLVIIWKVVQKVRVVASQSYVMAAPLMVEMGTAGVTAEEFVRVIVEVLLQVTAEVLVRVAAEVHVQVTAEVLVQVALLGTQAKSGSALVVSANMVGVWKETLLVQLAKGLFLYLVLIKVVSAWENPGLMFLLTKSESVGSNLGLQMGLWNLLHL